ncbi:MAG: hypothetical protein HZC55_10985 [Verrucomicrobia bacterium]|nr:hypothetical protein [Verrucomicrobiota bacterium]
MSAKIDRARHGPSWAEVILGAALSVILGAVLGAVLLIVRPVAKEPTKAEERVRGVVYYTEGSRDPGKARQALQKRKAFVEGQSISLVEEELNALANPGAATPPPAGKAPEKGKAADKGKTAEKSKEAEKPAGGGGMLAVGAPVFRLRDGQLQIGVPVTVNALDLGLKLVAHARGGIAKQGDGFQFEFAEMYLGSCPVHRLPFLGNYVRDQFIAAQTLPEDVKASWAKLASAKIEGNLLKLTMP